MVSGHGRLLAGIRGPSAMSAFTISEDGWGATFQTCIDNEIDLLTSDM